MPNWCWNNLSIDGEGASRFVEDCYGYPPAYKGEKEYDMPLVEKLEMEKKFTLNALHPVPQEVLDFGYSAPWVDGKKVEGIDGYHWQAHNWGTKWDIEPDIYSNDGDAVGMNFDSAWSPIVEWVSHVAKLYPHLTFTLEYHEGGVGYAGRFVATGEDQEDTCYQYGDAEYKKFVAEDLEYGWEYFEDDEDEAEEEGETE